VETVFAIGNRLSDLAAHRGNGHGLTEPPALQQLQVGLIGTREHATAERANHFP
jgi:hypothetical protein